MKKLNKYQPKRDLEIYCYALVHQDVKGNKLEAERLSKVDRGKFYWAYKTSEEFRHWFAELCFSILGKNAAIPPYALMGAILDKDVQAIRTYYELTGRLKNNGQGNNIQVSNIIYNFNPKAISERERLVLENANNR